LNRDNQSAMQILLECLLFSLLSLRHALTTVNINYVMNDVGARENQGHYSQSLGTSGITGGSASSQQSYT